MPTSWGKISVKYHFALCAMCLCAHKHVKSLNLKLQLTEQILILKQEKMIPHHVRISFSNIFFFTNTKYRKYIRVPPCTA